MTDKDNVFPCCAGTYGPVRESPAIPGWARILTTRRPRRILRAALPCTNCCLDHGRSVWETALLFRTIDAGCGGYAPASKARPSPSISPS